MNNAKASVTSNAAIMVPATTPIKTPRLLPGGVVLSSREGFGEGTAELPNVVDFSGAGTTELALDTSVIVIRTTDITFDITTTRATDVVSDTTSVVNEDDAGMVVTVVSGAMVGVKSGGSVSAKVGNFWEGPEAGSGVGCGDPSDTSVVWSVACSMPKMVSVPTIDVIAGRDILAGLANLMGFRTNVATAAPKGESAGALWVMVSAPDEAVSPSLSSVAATSACVVMAGREKSCYP